MERAQSTYHRYLEQPINEKQTGSHAIKTYRKRWHFKPRTVWPFVMWGLSLFLGFKIVVLPLIEGVYNYIAKTREVSQLKDQYLTMQKQLIAMKKKRDYMKTPSYVEERAHEIGLVKPEEAQMVVIEGVPDGKTVKKVSRKKVEIGD